MLGYRSNDAVLTICQNNAAKSIEIIGMNAAASALTGYGESELEGCALADVVPEKLGLLLGEYVEYEEDGSDVGAVLSKVQSFGIRGKDGKEKTFHLKVVRGESTTGRLGFRLVLQDMVGARKDDALRTLIHENFKGHEVLHPVLGVPDRKSLEKDIDLVAYYHHKAALRASVVVMQIDHFAELARQYSEVQTAEFTKHLIHVCRSNLRPGDVVGALGEAQIGILLFDAVSDLTRMVANRLRWQIAAQPYQMADKSTLALSASMVFSNIEGSIPAAKLLATCEAALAALPEGTASHLAQVAA